MMSGNKTRDGIRISTILSALANLPGVTLRDGKNHPTIVHKDGYSRLCPVATSTDARRMVMPWVRSVTTYHNSWEIYDALRRGYWRGEDDYAQQLKGGDMR